MRLLPVVETELVRWIERTDSLRFHPIPSSFPEHSALPILPYRYLVSE